MDSKILLIYIYNLIIFDLIISKSIVYIQTFQDIIDSSTQYRKISLAVATFKKNIPYEIYFNESFYIEYDLIEVTNLELKIM